MKITEFYMYIDKYSKSIIHLDIVKIFEAEKTPIFFVYINYYIIHKYKYYYTMYISQIPRL